MQQILLIVHFILAVAIIGLVMVQQGKGSGMGSGFGGGASGTVFGSQGNLPFLFKITVTCAALFFATSLTMAALATRAVRQQPAVVSSLEHSLPTQLPIRKQG